MYIYPYCTNTCNGISSVSKEFMFSEDFKKYQVHNKHKIDHIMYQYFHNGKRSVPGMQSCISKVSPYTRVNLPKVNSFLLRNFCCKLLLKFLIVPLLSSSLSVIKCSAPTTQVNSLGEFPTRLVIPFIDTESTPMITCANPP